MPNNNWQTSSIAPYFEPDWVLPSYIKAVVTTTGFSGAESSAQGGYGGFNLATHVGDDRQRVLANRECLQASLALPLQPLWLTQVHGVAVAECGVDAQDVEADASVSRSVGHAAAVLTADCLPVLFYADVETPVVAAAHAGWRGLCNGVLESTVAAMAVPTENIACWLGPAIGPQSFEVGPEVRDAFISQNAEAQNAFSPSHSGKYLADIYALARLRLRAAGVRNISGGGECTVADQRYYSYRRAGQNAAGNPHPSGRMASMIWVV